MAEPIELGELVDYVASQLVEAEAKGAKRSRRILELEDVELELSVTFQKRGKAGIKAYVVELGGGVDVGRTHRIKVAFKPYGDKAAVFEAGDGEAKTDVT
jgi:hypothetical protein